MWRQRPARRTAVRLPDASLFEDTEQGMSGIHGMDDESGAADDMGSEKVPEPLPSLPMPGFGSVSSDSSFESDMKEAMQVVTENGR